MGIPSTTQLLHKFPNMSLLVLTISMMFSVASAHGGNCKCGSSGMVCERHQLMFWGMLGVLLTYLYMYASYYYQRYCARFFARWCCGEEEEPERKCSHEHGHGCCGHDHDHCCHHDHDDCDHDHDCNHKDCDHKHDDCDLKHGDCHHCGHTHGDDEKSCDGKDKKDL